jgi:hypothetical protein
MVAGERVSKKLTKRGASSGLIGRMRIRIPSFVKALFS